MIIFIFKFSQSLLLFHFTSTFFYEQNKNTTIGEICKSKTIFHFSSSIERRGLWKLDKLITLTPDFDKVFPSFSQNKENLNRKRWMFSRKVEAKGKPSFAQRQCSSFEIQEEIFMKTTDKKLMSEGYKMFWLCLFFTFSTFYFPFFFFLFFFSTYTVLCKIWIVFLFFVCFVKNFNLSDFFSIFGDEILFKFLYFFNQN